MTGEAVSKLLKEKFMNFYFNLRNPDEFSYLILVRSLRYFRLDKPSW